MHDERSRIYDDALVAARDHSADMLLACADAFQATVMDEDAEFPGEVGRFMAAERLRAIRTELERRERNSRLANGVGSPADRKYGEWRQLAQIVREQADMLRVFDACGYHVHDWTKQEGHGSCPVCAGTDRLVITAGPPDLCWCRQCKWGGDVITVAMSFGRIGFRDAVMWLADLCGSTASVPA